MPKLTTRELLKLALPSMAFALLTNAYRSVDQYWIQGVSTPAQAAIGSSTFVLITFYACFHLVAGGAGPLVSRTTGAGDLEARREVIGNGLVGALFIALAVGCLGTLFADPIAGALGLSGETRAECAIYLRTLSMTLLPLVLTPLVDQSFIHMGNARVPMVLHAISLGINIVLTPLLIFRADLGIAGAALASNGSRMVTTGMGLWLLWWEANLRISDLRPGPMLRRILSVGWPVSLGIGTYSLVYWGLLVTSVSPLGPHVNAALGIGFSALEGFTWPMFHGVSLAVSSFVGRYLGAGQPEMAKKAVRMALPLITLLGVASTCAFFFGGAFLTSLFTDDPKVHMAATEYAVLLSASQLFVAWETLFQGALVGAGATRLVFWLSAPLNILRVPLAWVLAFPLGWKAAGIWWAINATTLAKATLKGWVVLRGRWVETRV